MLSSYKDTILSGTKFKLSQHLSRLTIIGLIYSIILLLHNLLSLDSIKLNLFNDSLTTNNYLSLIELLIYIISIIILLINTNKLNNSYGRLITEYPVLCLFTILGSILLIKSNNMLMMFIAIELQSYSLYCLSVIYNETENSTKAGLKYFFLGGLASIIILLGIGLIYGETGVLNIEYIISLLNYNNINNQINYGIIVIIIGYLFKVGAAPFHSWSPDVYNEVPTKITAWISVIPKIGLLVYIGLLSNLLLSNNKFILMLAGILSILIGAIGGVSEINFKRLLGYSGITNVGYLLLTLSSYNNFVKEGFVIYLIQYSLISANIFLILILLGIYKSKYLSNNSILSPIRYIKDFNQLFNFNPLLIICLTISLFSLIGIPPLIGFYSKYWLIQELLSGGLIYPSLILILGSVISSYYYLNVIKNLYKVNETNIIINNDNNISINLSPVLSYMISSLTIFTLFMFSDFESILQGIHILSNIN